MHPELSELPVPVLYVPAEHDEQAAELRNPVPVVYVPAGQAAHPFTFEYVPTGHMHTAGALMRIMPLPPAPPTYVLWLDPPPPPPVPSRPVSPA